VLLFFFLLLQLRPGVHQANRAIKDELTWLAMDAIQRKVSIAHKLVRLTDFCVRQVGLQVTPQDLQ